MFCLFVLFLGVRRGLLWWGAVAFFVVVWFFCGVSCFVGFIVVVWVGGVLFLFWFFWWVVCVFFVVVWCCCFWIFGFRLWCVVSLWWILLIFVCSSVVGCFVDVCVECLMVLLLCACIEEVVFWLFFLICSVLWVVCGGLGGVVYGVVVWCGRLNFGLFRCFVLDFLFSFCGVCVLHLCWLGFCSFWWFGFSNVVSLVFCFVALFLVVYFGFLGVWVVLFVVVVGC